MKYSLIITILFAFFQSFSQEDYLNNDGTISNYAKRQLFVNALNDNSAKNIRYEIDQNDLFIITAKDCGEEKYAPEKMQKFAMLSSFDQLKEMISILENNGGYDIYNELGVENIVFKTNTICMQTTRRYHFKFSLGELRAFPEYMDIKELFEYITVTKKNENIILVKNEL